jgi:hypothetical protein
MRFGAVVFLVMGLTGCGGASAPGAGLGPDSVQADMARAPSPADMAHAAVIDQGHAADMTRPSTPDMAEPPASPDLAQAPVADMAEPTPAPDLAKAPDMTPPPPDMTQLPDMTPPPPPVCGGLGQTCCDTSGGGEACTASNHNCVEGICKSCMGGKCYTCGTDWLPLCPGANKCAPGYSYVGDGHGGGNCFPCGGRGQPCCNQRFFSCPPSPNLCWTGDCYQGTCNGATLYCQ